LRPAAVPGAGEAHVVVRGLGVHRGGRWLFRGLGLALSRGETLAVVGPSGAGKSSLLACLAGLLEPTEGDVAYAGGASTLRPPAALRGRMGLVFQELRLVPTSTLLRNVLCGRLARRPWWATALGLPRAGRDEALALLEALSLGEVAHRRASRASGGEQQRAALARALFLEPEVVLADEPVSALDVEGAAAALALLKREAARRRTTVVCVLHDPPLVERFADRVLVVDPRIEDGWRIERPRALALERRA
jgi:phosphonate transport system ATP-binding protein